ncbi:MAG: hypothetical protein ACRDL5_14130 [Solirubrobacteraceae bacterium]
MLSGTAAVTLALTVGFGLGHLLLGASGRSAPTATSIASTQTGSTSTRSSESGPAAAEGQGGSVRSPVAAITTAVSYLAALEPATASTGPQVAIQALTSGPLTARALRAQASAALLERRIGAGGPAFMRGWPLGYRILSASGDPVRVAIWTMGLVASHTELVSPQWSTTTCTLGWRHGHWRVLAASTASGPTPPAAGSSRAAVDAFVAAASAFRDFGDAP